MGTTLSWDKLNSNLNQAMVELSNGDCSFYVSTKLQMCDFLCKEKNHYLDAFCAAAEAYWYLITIKEVVLYRIALENYKIVKDTKPKYNFFLNVKQLKNMRKEIHLTDNELFQQILNIFDKCVKMPSNNNVIVPQNIISNEDVAEMLISVSNGNEKVAENIRKQIEYQINKSKLPLWVNKTTKHKPINRKTKTSTQIIDYTRDTSSAKDGCFKKIILPAIGVLIVISTLRSCVAGNDSETLAETQKNIQETKQTVTSVTAPKTEWNIWEDEENIATTIKEAETTAKITSETTIVETITILKTITEEVTTTEDTSPIVYITPTGSKYHYDNTCNGGTYKESTLNQAERMGLEPCNKCVLG